jgi:hypothetical protein
MLTRRASALLYLPALVILVVYFWAFAGHAWATVLFPYQIDYGEGAELDRAWRVAMLQPMYGDYRHAPYMVDNYTPLYALVSGLGVALAGAQFFTGRLIALACSLVAGACIAGIAWTAGGRTRGAAVAGLLFFAGQPVWNWGAWERVDTLALALELAGVLAYTAGWLGRGSRRALWLTVPLFVAAAFTRQSEAAGAAACYLHLLLSRPREAVRVVGGYAALGLALFGTLQLLTAGRFAQHIVGANVNQWSINGFLEFWRPFWRFSHWTGVFAAVAPAALLVRQTRSRALVALLYLVAGGATALTMGKLGANVNYLLQLWAGLCIAVGMVIGLVPAHVAALARRWAHAPRGSWLERTLRVGGHALLAGWLLIGLQQMVHAPHAFEAGGILYGRPATVLEWLRVPRLPLWRLDPWGLDGDALTHYYRARYMPMPSAQSHEWARRTHEYVAAIPGEVFSEEMSFTVTTGRRVYVEPSSVSQLMAAGLWDPTPLLDDLRRAKFGVVVLRFKIGDDPGYHGHRVGPAMVQAIDQAYALDAVFGDYYLYRPRAAR